MKKNARSFKGWNFLEWLKGNSTTIKEVVKVGVPLFVGWTATSNPAMSGFITIVGKFVLDVVEYWIKPR